MRLHRRPDHAAGRAARARDAETARMLAAFVHERVAAGPRRPRRGLDRDRPPSAGDELAAIEAERASRVPRPPRGGRAGAARITTTGRSAMRIFEPHAHMTSRTTDDYEAMAAVGRQGARRAGLLARPAAHLGRARSSTTSTRCSAGSASAPSQFGIRHHCTIGLNPKEANDDALRREVLALLPRFLAKDGVVAVGEIGFDAMTPRRGRGAARAVRPRARARAAGARPHAAPRQAGGHAQHARARRGDRARARDAS